MVCAHCVQAGLPEELEQVFRMGTYNPAANALIEGYGTEPGCVANLVVHSSPTPDLVIIDQAPREVVIKDGVVIARGGKLV